MKMFFMMGITDRQEDLDYSKVMICDVCGAYGRFNVFMVCSMLTLFFIPVFKWNYRYYVRTSCCDTLYELDPKIGRAIQNGENIEIRQEDLHLIQTGRSRSSYKRCLNCGYETSEDFEYCPKCGKRFEE